MKTIEQLFDELKTSEELKKELSNLLKGGNADAIQAFIKQNGCDASLAEVKAFLREEGQNAMDHGELTPEELEAASGGTGPLTISLAIATLEAALVVVPAAIYTVACE